MLGLLDCQPTKLSQPAGCWLTELLSKSSLTKKPLPLELLDELLELEELLEPPAIPLELLEDELEELDELELDEELLLDELLLEELPAHVRM